MQNVSAFFMDMKFLTKKFKVFNLFETLLLTLEYSDCIKKVNLKIYKTCYV